MCKSIAHRRTKGILCLLIFVTAVITRRTEASPALIERKVVFNAYTQNKYEQVLTRYLVSQAQLFNNSQTEEEVNIFIRESKYYYQNREYTNSLELAVKAYEIAKSHHILSGILEALPLALNNILIAGARHKLYDKNWLVKELHESKEMLTKNSPAENYFAIDYMLSQYYGSTYDQTKSLTARDKAYKYYLLSIKNLKNLKKLARHNAESLIISALNPFCGESGCVGELEVYRRRLLKNLLKKIELISNKDRQAGIYMALASISEKEGATDEAYKYYSKALDLASEDRNKSFIYNKLNLFLAKKSDDKKYSDKLVQIRNKSVIYDMRLFWSQYRDMPYELRERFIREKKGPMLQEGFMQPDIDSLILFDANIRNLALYAEKSYQNSSKSLSIEPEFITIERIQSSLATDELLVIIGAIDTNFNASSNPYKFNKQLLGLSQGRNSSYYAIFLTRQSKKFEWWGPKLLMDKTNYGLRFILQENVNDPTAFVLTYFTGIRNSFNKYGNFKRIYIARSGSFNLVPFATELIYPDQRSRPRITLVPTVRDFVNIGQHNNALSKRNAVVLFVNPQYDLSPSGLTVAQFWKPLTGSAIEGESIASTFRRPKVFSGKEANVVNLEYQAKNAKILHIAAHVFSALTIKGKRLNEAESGVVLAGANDYPDPLSNPAVVSASKIVKLPIDGLDLVTLSGCESGLSSAGEIESWFGVQRALFVSGARRTLTSLWRVDDKATAKFMSIFYDFLRSGVDSDTALEKTQMQFKNPKNGVAIWADPYYWAAWQLMGDWRPIPGL